MCRVCVSLLLFPRTYAGFVKHFDNLRLFDLCRILNGACTPVQCPVFDPVHTSLRCTDPDCSVSLPHLHPCISSQPRVPPTDFGCQLLFRMCSPAMRILWWLISLQACLHIFPSLMNQPLLRALAFSCDLGIWMTQRQVTGVVATMTIDGQIASSPVGYGDIVKKRCYDGYEIRGSLTSAAECGAQCQYTTNHGTCAPKMCQQFVKRQGDEANVTSTTAPYLGKIVFKCNTGLALKVSRALSLSFSDERACARMHSLPRT
jgi:hypothetical protein